LFFVAAQAAMGPPTWFAARAAEAAKTGAVGDSYALELNGNPSTGYRWQISKVKSENLGILRVDDLGYSAAKKQQGKVLVGAPQSYRFRISLLSTGAARIVFEYVRPWEGKPINSFEQRVEVRSK
jgi:predicted secreted protein